MRPVEQSDIEALNSLGFSSSFSLPITDGQWKMEGGRAVASIRFKFPQDSSSLKALRNMLEAELCQHGLECEFLAPHPRMAQFGNMNIQFLEVSQVDSDLFETAKPQLIQAVRTFAEKTKDEVQRIAANAPDKDPSPSVLSPCR